MNFVHIHLHTHFSRRDAIAKVPDIVKKVKALGQKAFAITDHGTVSGLMAGYKEATKHGLKFIFGCEFYFVPDVTIKAGKNYHLILLAKNLQGYHNMLKLMTIGSQEENFYYKPRIDMDILRQHSEGLIVTSACIGGVLGAKYQTEEEGVTAWSREPALGWASRFKEVFGDDYFIEIHANQMAEQIEYNKRMVSIAQELDIPLVAAVDSHYINESQASVHRKWIGIEDDNEGAYYSTDDYFIMSAREVQDRLSYLPQDCVSRAIQATVTVADRCDCILPVGKKNYPIFPVENQLEHLKAICREGWKEKIEPILTAANHRRYTEQINEEFDVLEKADYINYFLITHDFIEWCKNHPRPIRVGKGRGSVVGSLVAYLMGITKLDPIKNNLLFSRFASLVRVTPPDIDTDVPTSRRQEVIERIRSKYGEVFQARTFGPMKAKGALRKAGEALKFPPQDVMALSKKLNLADGEDEDDNITDFEHQVNALEKVKNRENKELIELAQAFVGIISNFSIHASAVIVFPSDPSQFTAIERQGDNYVTAFDFHDLEEKCGLLKLDILGLKTLDVINGNLALIGNKAKDFDIDNLPDEDAKTFQMLRAGRTAGCFQIESQGMTGLVKSMQPTQFRDLIPLVALFRPGCLQAGMVTTFVNRRKGAEATEYLHERLAPILGDTYGVMLYQEQVMQAASAMGGYSLGEADVLRRAIGRKKKEEMDIIVPELTQRCIDSGIEDTTAKTFVEQVEFFAGYGFNKSHSAAYGAIAYQTAYLKAHYPSAFMTALMNVYNDKHEDTLPYINECRELGITLLPPDINKSKAEWALEVHEGKYAIRVGLSYLKGVGKLKIVTPVKNFKDFMEKNPKTVKSKVSALIKAGAFPGEERGLLLAQLEWWKDDKNGYGRGQECLDKIAKYTNEGKFKWVEEWKAKLEAIMSPEAVQALQTDDAKNEREVLGFGFIETLDRYDLSICKEPNTDSRIEHCIGGEVVLFKKTKQKKGKLAGKDMAFVTVRTRTKIVELVLFAKDYKQLEEGEVYLIAIEENKIKDIREAKRVG